MLARIVGWRRERTVLGVLLCLPLLVLVGVFVGYPLVHSALLSFTGWSGVGAVPWVGLGNYRKVMGDEVFLVSLRNTLVYSAATVLCVTALSFLIAHRLFAMRSRRWDSFFRILYFLPYVIPLAVLGALWRFIYNPSLGLLNQALSIVGLGRLAHPWLGDQATALGAVIAVNVLRLFGFYMVLYYAGLHDIPETIHESATLDGASRWQEIRHLTWPMLRPVTQVVIVLTTIYSLRALDLIYIMTQGGPGKSTYVIALHVFQTAFLFSEFGYASALAFVLFAIILLVTSGIRRILRTEG